MSNTGSANLLDGLHERVDDSLLLQEGFAEPLHDSIILELAFAPLFVAFQLSSRLDVLISASALV